MFWTAICKNQLTKKREHSGGIWWQKAEQNKDRLVFLLHWYNQNKTKVRTNIFTYQSIEIGWVAFCLFSCVWKKNDGNSTSFTHTVKIYISACKVKKYIPGVYQHFAFSLRDWSLHSAYRSSPIHTINPSMALQTYHDVFSSLSALYIL